MAAVLGHWALDMRHGISAHMLVGRLMRDFHKDLTTTNALTSLGPMAQSVLKEMVYECEQREGESNTPPLDVSHQ